MVLAPVLHDIHLNVDAGELVAVLGANGAGQVDSNACFKWSASTY